MRYRTLGKTGLSVSEIGYGTWGIGKSGWIGAEDSDGRTLLPEQLQKLKRYRWVRDFYKKV
jgi:aryl-alcohol dehydrogenase-like predicted oxidoreductase